MSLLSWVPLVAEPKLAQGGGRSDPAESPSHDQGEMGLPRGPGQAGGVFRQWPSSVGVGS